jgi:hypothetical protein
MVCLTFAVAQFCQVFCAEFFSSRISVLSSHFFSVARLATAAAASALYRNQKLVAQWRGSAVNSRLTEHVASNGDQCEGDIALQLLTHGLSDE